MEYSVKDKQDEKSRIMRVILCIHDVGLLPMTGSWLSTNTVAGALWRRDRIQKTEDRVLRMQS